MKATALQKRSIACASTRTQPASAVRCRAAGSPTVTQAQVDAVAFEDFLLTTQQTILAHAEQLDRSGQKFVTDRWERPGENAGVQDYCHDG